MQWNRRIVFVLIGLCILAAFAVQGATPCPTGCTCLSPASALKMGYTTYCGGKQVICDIDLQKKPLYCYEDPKTACPADCVCLSVADAEEKGYPLCGGIKTFCGYDSQQNPLYCYEKVVPTTAIQYIKCPADSVCLSPYEAKSQNLEKDPIVSGTCGYSEQYQALMECYLLPPATPTPTPSPLSITQMPLTSPPPPPSIAITQAPPTTPPPSGPVITQVPLTTTTPLPLQPYEDICPSTCRCMAPTEALDKGFAACPDVVDACGYSTEYSERMYCYLTIYEGIVTTTPEPVITQVPRTTSLTTPIPLPPVTAVLALAAAICLLRRMKK